MVGLFQLGVAIFFEDAVEPVLDLDFGSHVNALGDLVPLGADALPLKQNLHILD